MNLDTQIHLLLLKENWTCSFLGIGRESHGCLNCVAMHINSFASCSKCVVMLINSFALNKRSFTSSIAFSFGTSSAIGCNDKMFQHRQIEGCFFHPLYGE